MINKKINRLELQGIYNKSQIDNIISNKREDHHGAYEEHRLVTYLEAIYNILQIFDDRLKKLEDK